MVRRSIPACALLFACIAGARSIQAAQAAQPQDTSLTSALPEGYTGKDIFTLACATCHGPDGKGSAQSVVGFDVGLPDFTD